MPAHLGGARGRLVLCREAATGAPLGDVFQFVSGLHLRGKIAYSRVFAAPPAGAGLVPPETTVTIEQLLAIAAVPIAAAEPRYRLPLERGRESAGPEWDIIPLGSIASEKYVEPLLSVFGERLLFPADLVGRGGMNRGGLMLRCARAGDGKRPPKLPKTPRPGPDSGQ